MHPALGSISLGRVEIRLNEPDFLADYIFDTRVFLCYNRVIMRKRGSRITLLFFSFYLIFAFSGAGVAKAENLTTDPLNKVNFLDQKIADNQKTVDELKAQEDTLKNQIVISQKEIENLDLKIQGVGEEITAKQAELDQLTKAISEKETELKVEEENLDALLNLIYKAQEIPLWEVFFSSKSFSDVINHLEYLNTIEGEIQTKAESIISLKSELESNKKESENKFADLQFFKVELDVSKDIKNNEITKFDLLLAQTQGDEKKYKELVKKDKQEQAAIIDEMAQISGTYLNVKYGGGEIQPGAILAWPMAKFNLSQPWGMTPYAKEGVYHGKIHNGVDIYATSYDIRVNAALMGEVILVSPEANSGGWGNLVIIKHPNGLSTLYGHLSKVFVKEGDQVLTGQAIGLQGSTGKSDGPHLHFSVYTNLSIVKSPSYYGPLWDGTIDPQLLLPKI